MEPPNWRRIFTEICKRGQWTLLREDSEPWVQVEIFGQLKECEQQIGGWKPMRSEVPYVTTCPVLAPKNADKKKSGWVKWVDICLHTNNLDAWCWLELKVRRIGDVDRRTQAALAARDVFRKDVAALLGFQPDATADIWLNPDQYTKAYWFDTTLKPKAEHLRSAQHHFGAAFLQLDGELDSEVWNEEILLKQVFAWEDYRHKETGHEPRCAIANIKLSSYPIGDNHWLLILEWTR